MMLNSEQSKIIEQLTQIEEAGEIILSKQQECVVYDRNRQKSREAVSNLSKSSKDSHWACLSDQFFLLPRTGLCESLKADINVYNLEIDKLKTQLKEDINWLHDLEGKAKLKGFDLVSLNNRT